MLGGVIIYLTSIVVLLHHGGTGSDEKRRAFWFSSSMDKPVILLAFANEQEGHRYLRDLPEELRRLQAILEGGRAERAVRAGRPAQCHARPDLRRLHGASRPGGDLPLRRPRRARIGSCSSRPAWRVRWPTPRGWRAFLGQRRNLELVFLNGCSTRAQAAGLLEAGVSAVIATARAIEDTVALEFAAAFYSRACRRGDAAARRTRRPAAGSWPSRGSRPAVPIAAPATSSRRPRRPRDRGRPRRRPRLPLGAAAGHRGPSWTGAGAFPRRSATRCSACPRRSWTRARDPYRGLRPVHPRRGRGLLRPGQGHPRALQPGHRPRHPARDPLLRPHRRGQVVGARRRPGPPAGASTTRCDTSAAIPSWACSAPSAQGLVNGRGREPSRPPAWPEPGSRANGPIGR